MDVQPIVGFGFIEPLFHLAFNLLIVFYRLFGENLGLAIIFFTLALRMLSLPFSLRQVRSAEQNREFQSKYKALQAKHKDNKEELTRELGRLQAEYLPGQLGGCLPLLVNILFFFQVFFVLNNILPHGESASKGVEIFNGLNYSFVPEFAQGYQFNLDFLGINLGQSAGQIGLGNLGQVWPYVLLILLVGITTYFSTKITAGFSSLNNQPGAAGATKSEGKTDAEIDESQLGLLSADEQKEYQRLKKLAPAKRNEKERKVWRNLKKRLAAPTAGTELTITAAPESTGTSKKVVAKDKQVPEDLSFSEAMQKSSQQMIYLLPLLQMLISFAFPAGLSLYSTVSGAFVIIQQLVIHRDKVFARFRN